MRKKPGKYLKFYYKCMESGLLPNRNGLCYEPILNQHLGFFKPDYEEVDCLREEGYGVSYWGFGPKDSYLDIVHSFSPLRQTIVLFMAAMNNEL